MVLPVERGALSVAGEKVARGKPARGQSTKRDAHANYSFQNIFSLGGADAPARCQTSGRCPLGQMTFRWGASCCAAPAAPHASWRHASSIRLPPVGAPPSPPRPRPPSRRSPAHACIAVTDKVAHSRSRALPLLVRDNMNIEELYPLPPRFCSTSCFKRTQ